MTCIISHRSLRIKADDDWEKNLALYKQKGSKVWWFEFSFDGQRIRQSARTASKRLAQDAEKAYRRKLEENHNGITRRKRPIQFWSAAEEYLLSKAPKLQKTSLQIERYNTLHLNKVFRHKLLPDITASDVRSYQETRIAAGASVRSVNLDFGTLRSILKRNRLWEDLKPDVSMLRDNSRHGFALDREQERRLLEECLKSDSRILYPTVVLALSTGMRLSEIRLLMWRQIDLQRRELTVGASKTIYGAGRILLLNGRAMEALSSWATQFPDREPHHYVFPAERGGSRNLEGVRCFHSQDPTKPIGSWRKAWESARTRAGVSPRFHDIRHTAVTRMLEGGVPLTTVSDVVGWSPSTGILMAKRYGHISSEAMKKAVACLE